MTTHKTYVNSERGILFEKEIEVEARKKCVDVGLTLIDPSSVCPLERFGMSLSPYDATKLALMLLEEAKAVREGKGRS